MISNVSELLKGFMDIERAKLDTYTLKHAPTIGKMYEGLTSDVLDRAIPLGLDLQITHGVIHDGDGNMTGEIDCMLVKNVGEKIPHTKSHKCHIKDVIAVFEVKKTLYSNDLKDSFEHLRGVLNANSSYIQNPKIIMKTVLILTQQSRPFQKQQELFLLLTKKLVKWASRKN